MYFRISAKGLPVGRRRVGNPPQDDILPHELLGGGGLLGERAYFALVDHEGACIDEGGNG